ncbi:hypothetical protein WN51_06242 [Melipona quadrifasciata]|uniref:Uncharacterized protein n=1 Tax=Melipona quadrifasciata TaxID=166423 RepID=A0A0N0U3C1_9HYME|nr:hypothetical protein WN51_06242 [Melipona quadrifasciata]
MQKVAIREGLWLNTNRGDPLGLRLWLRLHLPSIWTDTLHPLFVLAERFAHRLGDFGESFTLSEILLRDRKGNEFLEEQISRKRLSQLYLRCNYTLQLGQRDKILEDLGSRRQPDNSSNVKSEKMTLAREFRVRFGRMYKVIKIALLFNNYCRKEAQCIEISKQIQCKEQEKVANAKVVIHTVQILKNSLLSVRDNQLIVSNHPANLVISKIYSIKKSVV